MPPRRSSATRTSCAGRPCPRASPRRLPRVRGVVLVTRAAVPVGLRVPTTTSRVSSRAQRPRSPSLAAIFTYTAHALPPIRLILALPARAPPGSRGPYDEAHAHRAAPKHCVEASVLDHDLCEGLHGLSGPTERDPHAHAWPAREAATRSRPLPSAVFHGVHDFARPPLEPGFLGVSLGFFARPGRRCWSAGALRRGLARPVVSVSVSARRGARHSLRRDAPRPPPIPRERERERGLGAAVGTTTSSSPASKTRGTGCRREDAEREDRTASGVSALRLVPGTRRGGRDGSKGERRGAMIPHISPHQRPRNSQED